ncbi:max-binding protein MNT isoform X1 [Thunnus albacares]|uniref:max-binding protein MNT isoform X1 n=1 Tax=Thunnus maccoyii TaxID=8240 RepID=UPI001C4B1DAD|nr:max-binding protein MNT isoform X1 [Thunnus maccoyii]XP_044210239.1 max-binding protein MNT isoform X1 [Thunnus albacares]
MSIETLLEAAKFLELQAQQQQKAREDELKEKLRLEQLAEQRRSDVNYNSTIHVNNVSKAEELRTECRPAPIPPSLPPPSMPITVIPIPVVTPNPTGSPALPVATLSPPAAPPLASPRRDPHSPQEQSAAALPRSPQPKPDHPTSVLTVNHKQPIQNHHHHPQFIPQTGNTKLQPQTHQQLLQRYPGSIVSPPQQHALLPQSGPLLQQAPLQNGPISRGSPPDDGRQLDKKRPGGAGTREVHNKLEKNRRAHLKECFETLKKNIPNIDEKKTSNLSVLRSALRYIQTLKRKEKEYEHDMERLAREKIATQQRLAELKNELSQWMDVIEIDRVLRQTVQPEEDQASTSTASEGEDIMDDDLDEETTPRAPTALPTVPQTMKPELHKTVTPTQTPTLTPTTTTSFITQHISIQHKAPLLQPQPQPQPQPVTPPQPASKPAVPPALTTSSTPTTPSQALIPTHTQMVTSPSLHPTVIAHASVSHPSVIQAVNHVIQGGGPKHIAHLAPSTPTSSVQLAPGHQPIGHITVHPVAHLGPHLPALYPQPVAVTQSAVVGHITHTLNHSHAQVNGTVASQPNAAIVGKQTTMVAHHPQLVGQTVLNPVTMVAMPSFPISTLKLA